MRQQADNVEHIHRATSSSQKVAPPPFPNGWFCIGHIRDFAQGQVYSLTFLGQDIIAYKTSSGEMVAMDAYCPHLGAHLGRGMRGKPNVVKDDRIECVYHNFAYDQRGECVKSSLDISTSRTARVRTWPVHDLNGLIFVYHDRHGKAPSWTIPPIEASEDRWTPIYSSYDKIFPLHVQEAVENTVDTLHFHALHSMDHVEELVAAKADGIEFNQTLSIGANRLLPKALRFPGILATVQECAYGLGLVMARVEMPKLGLSFNHILTVTPIDGVKSHFRFFFQMAHFNTGLSPVLSNSFGGVPKRAFYKGLTKGIMPMLNVINTQDVDVWCTKTFHERPALIKEDGAIQKYRKWCQQFYPE